MMSECTSGLTLLQTEQLCSQVQDWFKDANNESEPISALAALDAVRQHPARRKCVLLAWKALEQAIVAISKSPVMAHDWLQSNWLAYMESGDWSLKRLASLSKTAFHFIQIFQQNRPIDAIQPQEYVLRTALSSPLHTDLFELK